MKNLSLLLLSLLYAAVTFAQTTGHQERIDAAFGQSFATQQSQLEPLIQALQEDEAANTYWIAYGQLRASIFCQATGKAEQAAKAAADAIQRLQNKENKSSEEHALLGYLLGYSIGFDPASVGKLSAKASQEYQQALKKNKNNVRAYVGLGISDFYRPASQGGGQKVEEYLLKAIALPDQSEQNGPSWGKNEAYYTLASYYQREGKTDKAKMYCMQGLGKYPQDYRLNQLKQSL